VALIQSSSSITPSQFSYSPAQSLNCLKTIAKKALSDQQGKFTFQQVHFDQRLPGPFNFII